MWTWKKMASDNSEYTCPVCYELYHDEGEHFPRILECNHTVCQKCFVHMIGNNRDLPCPICRDPSDVNYSPSEDAIVTFLSKLSAHRSTVSPDENNDNNEKQPTGSMFGNLCIDCYEIAMQAGLGGINTIDKNEEERELRSIRHVLCTKCSRNIPRPSPNQFPIPLYIEEEEEAPENDDDDDDDDYQDEQYTQDLHQTMIWSIASLFMRMASSSPSPVSGYTISLRNSSTPPPPLPPPPPQTTGRITVNNRRCKRKSYCQEPYPCDQCVQYMYNWQERGRAELTWRSKPCRDAPKVTRSQRRRLG